MIPLVLIIVMLVGFIFSAESWILLAAFGMWLVLMVDVRRNMNRNYIVTKTHWRPWGSKSWTRRW